MKAIILAAGRGTRMRPLTDEIPKALLEVNNKPLIVYHLEALARAGITDIVINLAHLGEQIQTALGDGSQYGVNIKYSLEEQGGYETGGGIYHALPLLGNEPFLAVNCDIKTDYDFTKLPKKPQGLAHLVLVDKPPYCQQGDFNLSEDLVIATDDNNKTFTGIAVYHPDFFKECQAGVFSVVPLLNNAMQQGLVTGEYYSGAWADVGTPDRLRQLQG